MSLAPRTRGLSKTTSKTSSGVATSTTMNDDDGGRSSSRHQISLQSKTTLSSVPSSREKRQSGSSSIKPETVPHSSSSAPSKPTTSLSSNTKLLSNPSMKQPKPSTTSNNNSPTILIPVNNHTPQSTNATTITSSSSRPEQTSSASTLAQNFRSKSPSFNFTVSKIQTYERVYQRVLQQKQMKNKQQPHHSFKTLNIYSDLALCLRLCGASPTTDHLMLHYNQHLKHSDESFTFGDFLDFLSKQYELERDMDYKDIFVKYFVLNSYGEKMLSVNLLKELLFESGLDPLTDSEEFDRFIKYILGDDYQKQVERFKKKQMKKKQSEMKEEEIQKPISSSGATLGSIVLTENGVEFVNPGVVATTSVVEKNNEVPKQTEVVDQSENEEKLELFISLEKFLELVKV
ncbi:hypothetical protein FDP41_012293 [Naegleria fowleri]|uniref:EF-hand domain-containing protein n=1 Tax=Naegleria fowleri TaxID=5763 RepID=A0A6A5C1T9_NAEFO|nr:uncharacterized protein FDP41_012293 [Naegleria fowleri]KAF0981636.1 hypothetical protein FDP41_012293 [Naegleria fowleri]CAG4713982.1 unnamed protein product [Naegleria fowleri]